MPDARIVVVGHPIGGTPAEMLDQWADAALERLVRVLAS